MKFDGPSIGCNHKPWKHVGCSSIHVCFALMSREDLLDFSTLRLDLIEPEHWFPSLQFSFPSGLHGMVDRFLADAYWKAESWSSAWRRYKGRRSCTKCYSKAEKFWPCNLLKFLPIANLVILGVNFKSFVMVDCYSIYVYTVPAFAIVTPYPLHFDSTVDARLLSNNSICFLFITYETLVCSLGIRCDPSDVTTKFAGTSERPTESSSQLMVWLRQLGTLVLFIHSLLSPTKKNDHASLQQGGIGYGQFE